jgi:hypothetical protein
MAKFYGKIGYAIESEVRPGVWMPQIQTHTYMGDVIKNASRFASAPDSTNDNVVVSNQISIIADPFANQNFHNMKYVEWMGTKWKITNVDVQYPRLLLTMGGVYNGE